MDSHTEEDGVEVGQVLAVPSQQDEAPVPATLPDVERLMRVAGEVGIADMEKMIELQFRVMDRQAEIGVVGALTAFKERCPEIPKFKKGGSFVDKAGVEHPWYYAPLDSIQRTIDPLMRPLGLSYSWEVEPADQAVDVTCVLRHLDGGERRSSIHLPITGTSKMTPAQKWSGTTTFGKRITIGNVLGLAISDDIDGYTSEGVELISEEQVEELSALVEEVLVETPEKAAHERVELFLAFLGVKAIAELGVDQFDEAKRSLEAKRAQEVTP